MVAQGPLEAFVMVRIHAGQPTSFIFHNEKTLPTRPGGGRGPESWPVRHLDCGRESVACPENTGEWRVRFKRTFWMDTLSCDPAGVHWAFGGRGFPGRAVQYRSRR